MPLVFPHLYKVSLYYGAFLMFEECHFSWSASRRVLHAIGRVSFTYVRRNDGNVSDNITINSPQFTSPHSN
jgi:hypothetical protein